MDRETIMQSEIGQKEKNKYCILMHICGIQKNGTNEPICKAEIEIQIGNKCIDTKGEREGGGNWETGVGTYTLLILRVR